MADEKKIQNVWDKIIFKDKKTKKVAIVCEAKSECRPAKPISIFKNEGGDLIHDYEVVEWNLKEDKDEMPYEGGEYDGEEINDTSEWIVIVEKKYNLIYENEHLPLNKQIKETVRVEWEDGTITENNRDDIFG
jgi:hypothetical protein|tara:strand:- start:433 stop:831 length:399 start_codon:yes stop_codon:yes gene_type:complete